MVALTHLSNASDELVKQRLRVMFAGELVEERSLVSEWTFKRYLKDQKYSRKFKYLAVFLLNAWISQSELVQKQMALQAKQD